MKSIRTYLLAALLTLFTAGPASAGPASAAPGDPDPLNLNLVESYPGSYVSVMAVQPDGKTILGGGFTSVLGVARNRIARLNADGTLDAGFDPNADYDVYSVAVQADGKILLGGRFDTVGGTARSRIARVNADGTLDAGFNPNAGSIVYSVALQADGKILLGGFFSTVGGAAHIGIARVNADGTLDMGFNPNADGSVNSVAVQADGKILLGGGFTTVGGTARNYLARVNADGTLDAGFDPNASGPVYSVAVQADGKILLGGNFTTVGGTARNNLARVNADGTLDAGFDPNANSVVLSVAVQADGKILLGGGFSTVGGTARNLFARLINDSATQTLTAPSSTQALWTRGGAGPELWRVTFEQSTDGGTTYTALGAGTRVGTTANWQLSGLSLSGNGLLRARGWTAGGIRSGSSGLIEQVVAFTFYTPLQQWKLTHLGDAAAPNDGDTDFDGLRTLLEYATGGDPLVAGALPAGSTVAGKLALTFPRNTAATDVTLTVQGSDNLATWTDLARSTAGAPMVALVGGVNVAETGAGALRTVEVRDLYLTTDPAHPRRFFRLHAQP